MSIHCFDTDIAKKFGINAGIVYHHFCFWTKNNTLAERNLRDGKYWTYNTIEEIDIFITALKRAIKMLL